MPGPFLWHLAATARAAREQAGVRQIDVATEADVSHSTISMFERAHRWPLNPERIIDAYATETGRRSVDLWTEALDAWKDTRR